jgi:hypothetical protein
MKFRLGTNIKIVTLHSPIQVELILNNYELFSDYSFVVYRARGREIKHFKNAIDNTFLKPRVYFVSSPIHIIMLLVTSIFFASRIVIGNYNSGVFKILRLIVGWKLDILDEGSNIYLFPKRLSSVKFEGKIYTFSKLVNKVCESSELISLKKIRPIEFSSKFEMLGKISNSDGVIIGSADVEEGIISQRHYFETLEKVPNKKILYIAHRRSSSEKLRFISKKFDVIFSEVPIEYLFACMNSKVLSGLVLYSFGSTAENTLSQVYKSLEIQRLYFCSDEIIQEYRTNFEIILRCLSLDVKLNRKRH